MIIRNIYKKIRTWMSITVFMVALGTAIPANASEFLIVEYSGQEEPSGSLISVTGESHIYPIEDGTGKYLLKSDGYYCLNGDGSLDMAPGVNYFDHVEIDGVIFNGYYYHDSTGKFRAGNEKLVQIQEISCNKIVFDGYYMVGNLGKMSAASQVRYLDGIVVGETTFQGYYYFNRYGRLTVEPNTPAVYMTVNGKEFAGNYYFGGENGVLVEADGVTEEGIPVDAEGKVAGADELGMEKLQPQLEEMIQEFEGDWSIYVKDLGTDESFSINNRSMYSASLIKAFVLAKTYQDYEAVLTNQGTRMAANTDSARIKVKLDDLMWNMITISDNESYNELVRLQSDAYDFLKGAEISNEYLITEGYGDTKVQHTLHPSNSAEIGITEDASNMTSVEDCGLLLERIVEGECVSADASQQMLEYLKNQTCTWKIPVGVPEGIVVANKTGETDVSQHDIAVVYGAKTTYILCVMSENWTNSDDAIDDVRSISKVVYAYLNY